MKSHFFVLIDVQPITMYGYSCIQVEARLKGNERKKYKLRFFGFHPRFYVKNNIEITRYLKTQFSKYILDIVEDKKLKKSVFGDNVLKVLLKESKYTTHIRDNSCVKCGKVFAVKPKTCPRCKSDKIRDGIGWNNTFLADVLFNVNFLFNTNIKSGFELSDAIILNEYEKKIPLEYLIDISKNFYGKEQFTIDMFNELLKDKQDKDIDRYEYIDVLVPFFDDYMKYLTPIDLECNKRLWLLDIETDNSQGMDFKKFIYQITHIGWYDNYTSTLYQMENASEQKNVIQDVQEISFTYHLKYSNRDIKWLIYKCRTETILVEKFLELLKSQDPDTISAWNMDRFDKGYLVNRIKEIGLDETRLSKYNIVFINPGHHDQNDRDPYDVDIKGTTYFDLLEAYKRITRYEGMKPNLNLDAIGKDELKLRKIALVKKGGHKPSNVQGVVWKQDPILALYYNARDIEIMIELNDKLKIIDFFDIFNRDSGCLLENTLSQMRMIDADLIRSALHEEFFVLPTAMPNEMRKSESEGWIQGAFILVPTPGIHYIVFMLDIKSWYPTIVELLNLSPDMLLKTKIGDCICIDDKKLYFRKDKIGFVVKLLKKYKTNRSLYKNCVAIADSLKKGNDFTPASIKTKYLQVTPDQKDKFKANVIDLVIGDIFKYKAILDPAEFKLMLGELKRVYKNYQNIFKEKMNAVYGVMLHPAFRLFNRGIGETIPYGGRTGLTFIKKITESQELKDLIFKETGINATIECVYMHTDSARIKLNHDFNNNKEEMLKVSNVLNAYINKKINAYFQGKFNSSPKSSIEIRTEKIARIMAITKNKEGKITKNRCFFKLLMVLEGDRDWKDSDEVEISGYESVRSNTPTIAAKFQELIINMIINGKTEQQVQDIYKKFKKAYVTGKFKPSDICLNVRVTKDKTEYKAFQKGQKIPQHLRAIDYSRANLNLNWLIGDKVRFVFVKKVKDGLENTDVVGFQQDEDLAGFTIDYEYMFNKTVVSIMESIISLYGVKSTDMLNKFPTVFDFLSKNLKHNVKKIQLIHEADKPKMVN